MFADCREAVAAAAFARLRPQASTPYFAPCALAALPACPRRTSSRPTTAIVNPAWSRRAAAERLGVGPIELPGGHSPYLARPAAVADVLEAQLAGADVLRVDLLPPREVLLAPARPVDRPSVERVGEVLEVDVPAGEREHDGVVRATGVSRSA